MSSSKFNALRNGKSFDEYVKCIFQYIVRRVAEIDLLKNICPDDRVVRKFVLLYKDICFFESAHDLTRRETHTLIISLYSKHCENAENEETILEFVKSIARVVEGYKNDILFRVKYLMYECDKKRLDCLNKITENHFSCSYDELCLTAEKVSYKELYEYSKIIQALQKNKCQVRYWALIVLKTLKPV